MNLKRIWSIRKSSGTAPLTPFAKKGNFRGGGLGARHRVGRMAVGKPLLVLLVLISLGRAGAATVNVSVVNFAFSPAAANINVNDQVVWVWAGNNHNVVSTAIPQAWPASPVKSTPFSFTNQFTSAGSFPYECSVHGFTGSINVTAPKVPPTVAITSPAADKVFSAPADISISVSAAASVGTLTNLEILLGSSVVTTLTAPPYSAAVSNVMAGNYTLAAIATDNQGARATNSVNFSVVTPVASEIAQPKLSATNFTFSFNATVGLDYVVQATADLVSSNWSTVFTNAPASNTVVRVEFPLNSTVRYYRVGRLPNP